MHTLVICLDGFDLDHAAPLLDAGRLPTLARLLQRDRAGSFAAARSFENGDAWMSWMTALCGVGAQELGITSHEELDGTGHLRRGSSRRRAVATIYEAAALAGRRVVAANLPFRAELANDFTLAVTDDYFAASTPAQLDASEAVIGLDAASLVPLRVSTAAISTAQLARLLPAHAEIPPTDVRHSRLRQMLARALTEHQIATALLAAAAGDAGHALLACVRYTTVAGFFNAFVDHVAPAAPYVSKEDEQRFAPLLPAVMELHDAFVARLIALMPAGTRVVAVSEHGYFAQSQRPVPIGTTIRRLSLAAGVCPEPVADHVAPQLADLDLHRPATAAEYLNTNAWIATDSSSTSASALKATPSPALPLTSLYEIIATMSVLPTARVALDVDPDEASLLERTLDDRLELGLAELDVLTDEARELHLTASLDLLCNHAIVQGRLESAIEWQRAKLARSFEVDTGLRLAEVLLAAGREDDALPLGAMIAARMPHGVRARLALAAALSATGDRSAAQIELSAACALAEPADQRPAQLAARLSLSAVAVKPIEIDPHIQTWLDCADNWHADLAARFATETSRIDREDRRLADHAAALERLRERPTDESTVQCVDPHRVRSSSGRHAAEERVARASAETWVNDGGATNLPLRPLLLELHRRIAAGGLPGAGRWRTTPIGCVGAWLDGTLIVDAAHAEPAEIPVRMQRMARGARLAVRAGLHPAIVAALLTNDLLELHPFADGNGRVSRLLTLEILRRGGLRATRYLNLTRRCDRTARLFGSTFALSNRGHPLEVVQLWVRLLADAYSDAADRAERLVATDQKS